MTAGPSAPQELSGRGEVITAFETVAGSESAPWVMLVDGISGSGKSTLAEWLCASWSAECPCSRLELTRTLNVEDVLRRLAAGFAPAIAARLDEELREVDAAARSIIDVDYSPKQSMDASRRASIDSSHQQANLTVDLGSYSESVLLEQRTRRLNALERALAPLRGTRWILFIDECEHLEHPDVSQFVLGELVQRLRASFPAMRLYLTGQSVPTARFGLADRLTRTLESFSEEVTASIAGEAGLGEDAVGLVYELSRGHPLLVGMAIELLSSLDGPLTAHLIAELERDLDDRARTEWLYGRILNRLPEGLRDIATHLALLEWFDLDVLGRLFDDVDAEVFDELERRSFIKTRPDRTLTCHDAIRRHLGRSMLERDARASRDFLRRAAAAYRDALNDEVIRLESIFVGGRLDYVSAAFRAACVGDPGSASMILTDIGLAVRAVHRDHAYSVLRVVEETAELPARLDGLARRMRNFLEREAGLQPMNEDAVFLLLDVAAQCHADGFDDLADWLRYRASGWARSAGKSELACSIAAEALEHVDDVANRLLLVRALVADGRSDDASEALTSAELAHDAPVPFGLMRAEIELLDGADDEALSRVRALQTDHPDESGSATRFLAEMLGDAGEFDQALRVLDELSDDDEVEATRELRARILISAGRVGEALEHVTPDAADVAEYEILLHLAERTAATQERLDEFVTKFILDPTTSSFVEIVAV